MKWIALAILFSPIVVQAASYPTSFGNAKAKAEKEVYFDHLTTFYCQCDFVFDDITDLDGDGNTHETMIKPQSCGYRPRRPVTSSGKPNERTSRIEWEHIMPAHAFGGQLDEWVNRKSFPECRKSNGKFLGGRECAYKLNPAFKKAHDDLNNLAPAVGELNADRSDYRFANLVGEPREYGQCDFEVNFEQDLVEPADDIKGDIARTYLYMVETHSAVISSDMLTMMLHWNLLDPVSDWECERNRRIEKAQGKGNHYVSDHCAENQ
ncbi:endonuclease [Vibrio mangrovi]|uniref:Endonuclease n=1 Tax=Vibrio mangrovi TaxID=474394 RepID=A0A1Y6IZE8_9VIBR|nr:endonuclease [Vibrio mangrovi]MDW6002317.1 endonuclease [Vibrio mangrovi]SMS03029.1 Extracellular deoxyribonuclease precursor [Vibrio mangrovi]